MDYMLLEIYHIIGCSLYRIFISYHNYGNINLVERSKKFTGYSGNKPQCVGLLPALRQYGRRGHSLPEHGSYILPNPAHGIHLINTEHATTHTAQHFKY